jgi:hypothetical protein
VPGYFNPEDETMKKNDYISPTEEAARLIPYSQLLVTVANPETYGEIWERLNKIVPNIPAIGATEGMKEHPAILHYFFGGADMYICEFDGKDEMFGFTILNGDDAVPPNGGTVNNIPIGKRPKGAYCEMAEWGYSLASSAGMNRGNLASITTIVLLSWV